jgi:hypothetical protein
MSLALACFVALAAFGGVGAALPEASNPAEILEPLQRLPWSAFFFTDLTWPRVFLTLIIGLPHAVAAILIISRQRQARLAVGLCGCLLATWMGFGAFIYGIDTEVTAPPVMVLFTAISLMEITAAWLWHDQQPGSKTHQQR